MQFPKLLLLACSVVAATAFKHGSLRKDEIKTRQLEAAKRFRPSVLEGRQSNSTEGGKLTFSNAKANGAYCFLFMQMR